MDEVKAMVIVPEHRTVLPGVFELNRCPPDQPLTSDEVVFLPEGNILQRLISKRSQRSSFRLPQCASALSGTWLAVGYEPRRNAYHDVGFAQEELAGMIVWEPKFAGLMATSRFKRLDTHRPAVRSGNERIRELDGATLRIMESHGLVESFCGSDGAPRWSLTEAGFNWLRTLHDLLDENLIVRLKAPDRRQLN